MNFTELYRKIQAIDEGSEVSPEMSAGAGAGDECGDNLPAPGNQPLMGEEPVEECGMDMPGDMVHPAPKQSDSVTMNVSMNGSGAGGIRDLMQILRNIEQSTQGGDDHNVDKLFGNDHEEEVGEDFQDATTRPNTVTLDIDSVTQTGNDLASKGGNEVEKVNGGGNPYTNVSEGLVSRLNSLYTEIREGSRPPSGQGQAAHDRWVADNNKKFAKNVKRQKNPLPGSKEEADRIQKNEDQQVAEGSAHGFYVTRVNEKYDQLKITKWLRKQAGLPKDAPLYFDDADLVWGDKTIVPNALVNPKLKMNDLLTATVRAAGQGQEQELTHGSYRPVPQPGSSLDHHALGRGTNE